MFNTADLRHPFSYGSQRSIEVMQYVHDVIVNASAEERVWQRRHSSAVQAQMSEMSKEFQEKGKQAMTFFVQVIANASADHRFLQAGHEREVKTLIGEMSKHLEENLAGKHFVTSITIATMSLCVLSQVVTCTFLAYLTGKKLPRHIGTHGDMELGNSTMTIATSI